MYVYSAYEVVTVGEKDAMDVDPWKRATVFRADAAPVFFALILMM